MLSCSIGGRALMWMRWSRDTQAVLLPAVNVTVLPKIALNKPLCTRLKQNTPPALKGRYSGDSPSLWQRSCSISSCLWRSLKAVSWLVRLGLSVRLTPGLTHLRCACRHWSLVCAGLVCMSVESKRCLSWAARACFRANWFGQGYTDSVAASVPDAYGRLYQLRYLNCSFNPSWRWLQKEP